MTCLDNKKNVAVSNNASVLPGLSYDFDSQCKFAFGKNATHCEHKKVPPDFIISLSYLTHV